MKACSKCGAEKALEEFPLRKDSPDGRRGECRTCRNDYQRDFEQRPGRRQVRLGAYYADADARREASRRWYHENGIQSRYGITSEQRDEMIRIQDGRCLVCDEKTERLHIDHCHKTGTVRGLLCGKCNRAIGSMNDDPERLRRAAAYLEASRVDSTC